VHGWEVDIKIVLKEQVMSAFTYPSGNGEGPMEVSCEHGDEVSGPIKGEEVTST
jgi:hypothetical protein